jgi:lactoylglutathione lyase
MEMIQRVEHVGIMVNDMNESIKFYEDLLGFNVRVRVNNGQKELAFLSHYGLVDLEIELIRDLTPAVTYSAHGLVNHLAFAVEDIDSVITSFRKRGVHFLTSKPKRGLNDRKTIRFKGPNGEMLQLVEARKD